MSAPFVKVDRLSGYLEGTTCVLADTPAKVKKTIPSNMKGATKFFGNLNGEGVYLEGGTDWDRVGLNFPNTKSEFSAATTSSIRVAMLTNSLGVVIYIVSTKLYAKAFSVGAGGAIAWGAAATVNDADSGIMPAICRISDSTYAIAYVDDGGDDYVFVRMGSVSGVTITQGAESSSFSAAVAANVDDGVGICQPRSGVVAVVWTSAADTYGYCTAAPFDTITVDTPGTPVEFATASQNSDIPAVCSHATGYVAVAYEDAGNSNYLTINIGTVSAAGVVAFGGSEEALNATSAINIQITSPRTNSMVISWLDNAGDPHLIAGGVLSTALTTFVQGAEASIATTATVPSHACISDTEVILAWCDDASTGDLGFCKRYSISWAATGAGTLTADSVTDVFTETSCKSEVWIAATTENEVIVAWVDTDSSAHGQCTYGQFREDIIDIRSSVASAAFSLWLSAEHERVVTN